MAESPGVGDDPWSTDAGVHARTWHFFAAFGVGAAYALTWLALGQPKVHLSQFILPASLVVGGIVALTGPSARRLVRAAPWFMAGFVALAASRLVTIAGLVITGDQTLGSNAGQVAIFGFGLLFFGGGWLNIARLTTPSRRLDQTLLDQIPPPAATRRQPRTVMVNTNDGRSVEVTLMQGGYLVRPRHVAASDIIGIAID